MDQNQYYLRIEDEGFGFVVEGIHDILYSDIPITTEDYNRFFELQSEGKQFRITGAPTGVGLFDYVEEYTPDPGPPLPPSRIELLQEQVLQQSEYMMELDYKLVNIELGL